MSYKRTEEQEIIVNHALVGARLKVKALAGSGKTSTSKDIALAKREKNKNAKGLYITYTKPMQLEATEKFGDTAKCVTWHGLAFPSHGRQFAQRLNSSRITASDTASFLGIENRLALGKDIAPLTVETLGRLAMETVTHFCYSADMEITKKHVPYLAGIDTFEMRDYLADTILPYAKTAWEDLTKPIGNLRFSHDIYLKLFVMSKPQLPYDYIILDECQDSNKLALSLLLNQKDKQVILVGDDFQQLYAWRGANNIMTQFDGEELYLSQSFRFGKAIADEANKWLSLLDPIVRIKGFDKIQSSLVALPEAKAVLCRTNAAAVSEVAKGLAINKKMALVRGGAAIEALAKAAITLKAGKGTNHPELCAFKSWNDVVAYVQTSEGGDLKPFVDTVEKYGADGVIAMMRQLVEEKSADIIVSTSHSSKGREWTSVRIADDFKEPKEKDGIQQDVDRSEAQLAYVSVTRAQHQLDRAGLAWVDKYIKK